MATFYLPFDDEDLTAGANNFSGNNTIVIHGAQGASLAGLAETGTLYVLAHGRFSTGSEIVGVVKGRVFGTRNATMKAPDLARALNRDGLPKRFGDVRLLVCWGGYVGGTVKDWGGAGGHTLKRGETDAPFAGQLCSALKALGYYRIVVTGYRGTVLYAGKGKTMTLSSVMTRGSDKELLKQPTPLNSAFYTPAEHTGATLSLDDASRTVWY